MGRGGGAGRVKVGYLLLRGCCCYYHCQPLPETEDVLKGNEVHSYLDFRNTRCISGTSSNIMKQRKPHVRDDKSFEICWPEVRGIEVGEIYPPLSRWVRKLVGWT
jgi:hypothetical protein